MNYEGIAALLWETWKRANVDADQEESWEDLYSNEQLPWIEVAKEAHRVIAAAVLT